LEKDEKAKGYVTISQEELAHRTGLIRQTVAKALGKWRRAGWLITGRGRILLLNRKALEELESNLLI
jgi:CRP/FNR family transcriptional regulator, anaerobic regulatory protein